MKVYDATISIPTSIPATLAKGDSLLIQIDAIITEPTAEITLEVFEPLGYVVSVEFKKKFGLK